MKVDKDEQAGISTHVKQTWDIIYIWIDMSVGLYEENGVHTELGPCMLPPRGR